MFEILIQMRNFSVFTLLASGRCGLDIRKSKGPGSVKNNGRSVLKKWFNKQISFEPVNI